MFNQLNNELVAEASRENKRVSIMTPKSLNNTLRIQSTFVRLLVGIITASTVIASATAALVIHSTDVVDDKYSYSLNYNKMYDVNGTVTNVIANDAWELNNMKFNRDTVSGSYRAYLQVDSIGTGSSFASVTYKFDFSDLGYAASSMTVYDYLRLDAPGSSSGKTYSATSYYSIDGTNWIQIRSVSTSSGTGVDGAAAKATTTIDFTTLGLSELPATIYYKAEYTSVGGTFSAGNNAQWARSSNATEAAAAEDTFAVSFNLTQIPEASTLAWTFVLSGIGVVVILRRRACDNRSIAL